MSERDDHVLTERFRALRDADAAGVTPFRATLAAVRARRAASPRRRRFGVVVAAAAAVALVLLFTRPPRHGSAIDLAAVRWRAPTDFLLNLPGDELLRSVPRLGRVNLDWRTP